MTLDATDYLVSAALVTVAAAQAPHLRGLAARLLAARDAADPEPQPGPERPADTKEHS